MKNDFYLHGSKIRRKWDVEIKKTLYRRCYQYSGQWTLDSSKFGGVIAIKNSTTMARVLAVKRTYFATLQYFPNR